MLHNSLRKNTDQRSLTIVLEWDNAEGLERDQALYFLQRLAANVRDSAAQFPRPVTLLMVFDDGVDQADLRKMLAECADTMRGTLVPKLLYAPQAEYYEKKGVAPFFADTDILVYADSDCRYCESWLHDILAPILKNEADVAHGATFALEDKTLVGKMSALAWFFPIASKHEPLTKKPKNRFFANNFATTRATMLQVPLPRIRAARTHGSRWFKTLHEAGLRTQVVPSAVAEHKQFDKFSELMARAWMFGKDKDAGISVAGGSRPYRIWRAMTAVLELNFRFLKRFFTVGMTRVHALDAVPIFAGGVMFQLIANAAQLLASVTQPQLTASIDYADLIASSRVLDETQSKTRSAA